MSTITADNNHDIESKCNFGNNKSLVNPQKGNEIITLCVGRCGSFVGQQFLSTIMNEQSINKQGEFIGNLNTVNAQLSMSKRNVYLDEINSKYIPRSIFLDLDAKSMNQIRCGYIGKLIPDENLMSLPYHVPSSNWARGHYTDGAECIDKAVEIIRNEMESCDNPQGFNLLQGISGGVGGGFSSLLLLKLRDNYYDKHIFTFSIYPSDFIYGEHNPAFEVYNIVLAFSSLLENADLCFSIDNAKLWGICASQLHLKNPSYNDLNWVVSLVLSGITSTLRFESEPSMNSTLKRMNEYFTPFPRLHFVSVSHSPFFTNSNSYKYYQTTDQILTDVLLDSNDMTNINVNSYSRESCKILNMCCVYRGNAENRLNVHGMMFDEDFVSWLPASIGSTLIYDNNCYLKYTPIVATVISHTTKIKRMWSRISSRFSRLYRRKTSLHYYKSEGMDEMEFQEAHRNIRDLYSEYEEKEKLIVKDEDEDQDESEDDY